MSDDHVTDYSRAFFNYTGSVPSMIVFQVLVWAENAPKEYDFDKLPKEAIADLIAALIDTLRDAADNAIEVADTPLEPRT